MRKTISLTIVKFLLIIILIFIMSISIFPSKSFLRGKSVNEDTLIINIQPIQDNIITHLLLAMAITR